MGNRERLLAIGCGVVGALSISTLGAGLIAAAARHVTVAAQLIWGGGALVGIAGLMMLWGSFRHGR